MWWKSMVNDLWLRIKRNNSAALMIAVLLYLFLYFRIFGRTTFSSSASSSIYGHHSYGLSDTLNRNSFTSALHECSRIHDSPNPLLLLDTPSVPSFMLCVHPPSTDIWISKPILEDNQKRMHMVQDLDKLRTKIEAIDTKGLIIDIGANIGVFSMYFARLGYVVVSFEPTPRNFERLAFSSCMNQQLYSTEVILKNNIVSNEIGKVYSMASQSSNMGHSMVVTNPSSSSNGGLRSSSSSSTTEYSDMHIQQNSMIYSTTVDHEFSNLCSTTNNNEHPLLMKVDVEGFEGFVFDGARRLLKDCPPSYIFIELNIAAIDAHTNGPLKMVDILLLLKNHGYQLVSSVIGTDTSFWNKEEDIRAFVLSLDPIKQWGDYLFKHSSV